MLKIVNLYWVKVILYLFIFSSFACGPKHEKRQADLALSVPSFKTIFSKIIVPKCIYCHNDVLPRGGVNLTNYENLLKYVNPGRPQNSRFYSSLNRMPIDGPTLPNDEKQLIKSWILSGAHEDDDAQTDHDPSNSPGCANANEDSLSATNGPASTSTQVNAKKTVAIKVTDLGEITLTLDNDVKRELSVHLIAAKNSDNGYLATNQLTFKYLNDQNFQILTDSFSSAQIDQLIKLEKGQQIELAISEPLHFGLEQHERGFAIQIIEYASGIGPLCWK